MLVKPKICFSCAQENYIAEKKKREGMTPEAMEKARTEDMNDRGAQQYFSLVFKDGQPFTEEDRNDVRFEVIKRIEWQSRPPFRKHLDRNIRAPPSQRVSVIAKLSLPDDSVEDRRQHLRSEAANYQAFPEHMFEHWNGYNVLQPMCEPTPCGVVVP